MNEVRSTNELPAVKQGARRSDKMIVLLQEVKETNTSVFDGIRHALTLHDAYETAIE
jgi:hypothetical protein